MRHAIAHPRYDLGRRSFGRRMKATDDAAHESPLSPLVKPEVHSIDDEPAPDVEPECRDVLCLGRDGDAFDALTLAPVERRAHQRAAQARTAGVTRDRDEPDA